MQTPSVSAPVAVSITLSEGEQTSKKLYLAMLEVQLAGYKKGDGNNSDNARFFEAATIDKDPQTANWVVSTNFTHSPDAADAAKKYINEATMDSDWKEVLCKHPLYSQQSTAMPLQPTIKQLVDYLASFTTLFWTFWARDIQQIVDANRPELKQDVQFITNVLVFFKTMLTPHLETINDPQLRVAHTVFSQIENRVFSYDFIQKNLSERAQNSLENNRALELSVSIGTGPDYAYYLGSGSDTSQSQRNSFNTEDFSSDTPRRCDSTESFKGASDASGITTNEPDSVQSAAAMSNNAPVNPEEWLGAIWHIISQVATQPITSMEIAAAERGAFGCGIDSDFLSSNALLFCPAEYTIRLLDLESGMPENMDCKAQFLALLHINQAFLKPVFVDLHQDMLFRVTVERFLDALLRCQACPVDIRNHQNDIKQFIHQSMSTILTQAIFAINLNQPNPVKNLARAAHQALSLMFEEQDNIALQSSLILAMYCALPQSGPTAFFPGCRAMLSIMHGELQQKDVNATHALVSQEGIAAQLQEFMQRRNPNDLALSTASPLRFFPIANALYQYIKNPSNPSP